MKNFCLLLTIISTALLLTCQQSKPSNLEQTVKEYYKVYQERNDFKQFLSFYSEDIILKDIIYGEKFSGKESFAAFFDWSNPAFKKTEASTLIINEQSIDKNKVITQGYFTPFSWGEMQVEAMHFTTILTFNEHGKIEEQIDWINYPNNLIDYKNRKNSNHWILNDE